LATGAGTATGAGLAAGTAAEGGGRGAWRALTGLGRSAGTVAGARIYLLQIIVLD